LSHVALLAALAVAAFQLAYYYPQLPAVIAGHFNAAGMPNSWEPKSVFFTIICIVYVIFAALAWAMPQLITSLPPELVHLPNKAYWLAPQRREQTAHLLGDQLTWLGVLEIGFIVCVVQLAINANLTTPPSRLGPALLFALGAFAIVLVGWTLRLYRTFSRISA
jgi:hypothetical protein